MEESALVEKYINSLAQTKTDNLEIERLNRVIDSLIAGTLAAYDETRSNEAMAKLVETVASTHAKLMSQTDTEGRGPTNEELTAALNNYEKLYGDSKKEVAALNITISNYPSKLHIAYLERLASMFSNHAGADKFRRFNIEARKFAEEQENHTATSKPTPKG